MKLSSSSSLHDNNKNLKKPSFAQLQIESRKDVETLTKIIIPDNTNQQKAQFSWQLYNSAISQQNNLDQSGPLTQYKQNNAEQSKKQIFPLNDNKQGMHQQFDSQIKQQQIQSDGKIQQQNKDFYFRIQQRQAQILYNKFLSNCGYLKTQFKQLQKLFTFSLLALEEKDLKIKIADINSALRKIRLRSISRKILSKDKNLEVSKTSQQIASLAQQIRLQKIRSNKLETKIVLMDNYISASRNSRPSISPAQNKLTQYSSQKCIEKKMSSSSRRRTSSKLNLTQKYNFYSDSQAKQAYYPTRDNIYYLQDKNTNSVQLLKQHAEILKDSIKYFNQHTNKRVEMIIMQKISLKKQIENIKLSILKLQNDGRRYRSVQNSLKRPLISERNDKILKIQNKFYSITSKSRQMPLLKYNSSEKSLKRSKLSSSCLLKYKKREKNINEVKKNDTSIFPQQIQLNAELPSNMKQSSTKEFSTAKNRRGDQYSNMLSNDIRKQYFNI